MPRAATKTRLGDIEFLSYMDSYLMEDRFMVRLSIYLGNFPL